MAPCDKAACDFVARLPHRRLLQSHMRQSRKLHAAQSHGIHMAASQAPVWTAMWLYRMRQSCMVRLCSKPCVDGVLQGRIRLCRMRLCSKLLYGQGLRNQNVTYHIFTDTTYVLAVPQEFAYVVIPATKLYILVSSKSLKGVWSCSIGGQNLRILIIVQAVIYTVCMCLCSCFRSLSKQLISCSPDR